MPTESWLFIEFWNFPPVKKCSLFLPRVGMSRAKAQTRVMKVFSQLISYLFMCFFFKNLVQGQTCMLRRTFARNISLFV